MFGRGMIRALAIVPVAAACLWGATAFAADGLDPARADELSHMALPGATDLGDGWTVTRQDDFTKDESPDTPACQNSQAKMNKISADLESGLAGRGMVELTKDAPKGPLSVQVTVEVYNDAGPLKDALPQVVSIVKGDDFTKCLQDSIGDGATVKGTSALGKVPDGGAGRGLDIDLPSISSKLHYELYTWLFGNTAVTITIAGAPSDVTAELTQFMLDGEQKALGYLSTQ